MAQRMFFIATPNEKEFYREEFCDFTYYSGFSITQKQKSIHSLHHNIKNMNNNYNILEISTKSTESVGVSLSAFNLKFLDNYTGLEYPLENIFQSSKVFENGGPYRDLLNVSPKDSKRDSRLTSSGNIKCFNLYDTLWALEPKTMFYDWIYIKSLYRNQALSKEILKYDVFTDIEFNHIKSINCQARSAAIFVSLVKRGQIDQFIENKKKFEAIYNSELSNTVKEFQISFFEKNQELK